MSDDRTMTPEQLRDFCRRARDKNNGHGVIIRYDEAGALADSLTALLDDARRYAWLRDRMTYYNVDADWPVEAPNIPVLAQVSDRIWYHATDDIEHDTLDATIDAAQGAVQEPSK